jgi:cytochrome bd-type quinol oxidase subunit 2
LLNEYSLYFFVVGFAVYGILIVPYFSSKILVRFGNSERFWFVIMVLFGFYALIYFLLRTKYRSRLLLKEKLLFVSFVLLYVGFLYPVLFLLE